LDELDALLQKMLGTPASLPDSVKPAERPKPIAPAPQQMPPPKPPQFPVPEVAFGVPPAAAFAASSQPTTTKPAAEERPAWAIDLNPREGSSVLGNSRGTVSPSAVATNSSMLSVTTIADPVAEQQSQAPDMQSAVVNTEIPLLLRPLAWLSDSCDAMLRSVPFGRLLTSQSGRTLMGYVGLAMLAASVVSGALAWVGWSW